MLNCIDANIVFPPFFARCLGLAFLEFLLPRGTKADCKSRLKHGLRRYPGGGRESRLNWPLLPDCAPSNSQIRPYRGTCKQPILYPFLDTNAYDNYTWSE